MNLRELVKQLKEADQYRCTDISNQCPFCVHVLGEKRLIICSREWIKCGSCGAVSPIKSFYDDKKLHHFRLTTDQDTVKKVDDQIANVGFKTHEILNAN